MRPKLNDIWAIRIHLQLGKCICDLASSMTTIASTMQRPDWKYIFICHPFKLHTALDDKTSDGFYFEHQPVLLKVAQTVNGKT